MSIRRRGMSWEVSIVLPNLPRIRRSFKDQEYTAAVEWEQQTISRHRLGLPIEGVTTPADGEVPITLGQLFARTHERYWKGQKAEESTLSACNVVENCMGKDQAISAIDAPWVDLLIRRLSDRQGNRGKKVSGSTINRKLAALSRACRYAENMGWIKRAPRIERVKENCHRLRFLSDEEEHEFEVACTFLGDTVMQDLFTVLVDTGMRLGEATNLKTEQVNLNLGSIHLWEGSTKNGKGRSVPITNRVRSIMMKRRHRDTIFPEVNEDSANKRFNRAKEKTSMRLDDLVVLHTLRHTFASRLVQSGVDIPTIRDLLGHSSIQMTMRYAHLAPANLSKAVAVLDHWEQTRKNKPSCNGGQQAVG